jgi:hypothetical protein
VLEADHKLSSEAMAYGSGLADGVKMHFTGCVDSEAAERTWIREGL